MLTFENRSQNASFEHASLEYLFFMYLLNDRFFFNKKVMDCWLKNTQLTEEIKLYILIKTVTLNNIILLNADRII